ncbi:MAG: BNR-4 repeat-containing protein [Planctomycetes bacterium]|nr:BNR-4 repeat-containing protein [Planctomycetota bacterium]MBL7041038.1 BNR-4 repeat-containing protein [Pirellulaceae bacterium]
MTDRTPFKLPTGPRFCILLATVTLTFQPRLATTDDVTKVHRELISSIGSERATSGNGNKIVTVDGKTHVVWQDANRDGYFARIRTLDRNTGKWSPTYTLGEGRDNHARPTITVDSQDYLHVIIGGHHSGLQYRRSVRPNDASEWTEIETFGKTTYPLLICGPDDTLYLTGRHDADWKGMDFYAKPPGEKWQHRGLLVAKQKRYQYYAAYHNALAWGPNHKTLHMSVGFFMGDKVRKGEHARDPQGLHQAVGYMRSDDFGKTWTKADGTPIELPATTDTIDLIDEGTRSRDATDKPKPGIQHCGLVVASKNRPCVFYVRHTPSPGRIFLKTPDGKGGWTERPLREAIEQRWPGLAAIGCNVSMTRDGVLCLILTLAPLAHPKANWSPGIYGRPAFWLRDYPNIQRLVWLESRDGGQTFTSRDIIAHDADRGTLLPTQKRPTGFNGVAAGQFPPLLYFEGLSRYRKPGEIIQNDVYFVQLD